jgi:hypothetical protein
MARVLRQKFGRDNVIMSDVVKPARRQWQLHGSRSIVKMLL